MIEIEVIKLDLKGVCVAIKRMNIDDWYSLKKQTGFNYRAYQINFHSFVVGK